MKEESDPISDLIAESGLDKAEYAGLAAALATLLDIVPEEAPPPSADLAALLSGGVVSALPLRRRTVALASSVAAALMVGTGLAAAANVLPDPAQRFLSHLSDHVLPFHFPMPENSSAPVTPTTPGSGHDNNGKQVGKGAGSGKTDNLGKGQGTGKPNPGNGHGKTNNGKHVGGSAGGGKTDNLGNGRPTAPPAKGHTADKPGSGQAPAKPTPTPRTSHGDPGGNVEGNRQHVE